MLFTLIRLYHIAKLKNSVYITREGVRIAMINPSKINKAAEKQYEENVKFRQFLKEHANSDKLDAQFLELHKELFANYDCCKCANCCRAYTVVLNENDVEIVSQHLDQSKIDFINENMEKSFFDEGDYIMKIQPCIFLCGDGKCQINDIKPSTCKDFPFTDKPDRISSMYSIIDFAHECPVVFEILERLKEMYGFLK